MSCNAVLRSRLWKPVSLGPLRAFNRSLATSTSDTSRPATEVRIVEVGPRDGLQNEKATVPVSTKIELIRRLATTGIQTIEAGSFVSSKWVPQVRQLVLGHNGSSDLDGTTDQLPLDGQFLSNSGESHKKSPDFISTHHIPMAAS